MKRLAIILTSCIAVLGNGCLEPDGNMGGASSAPVYRHHFAGSASIRQDTNATTLKKIIALPVSAEIRRLLTGKCARAPRQFWKAFIPASAPDQSGLFQPLFDELVSAESVGEVRVSSGGAEAALAVRLPDHRAAVWSTNLWRIAVSWNFGTPREISSEAGKGWEAKQGTRVLHLVRAGNWLVLGLGPEKLTLAPQWIQQIARAGRLADELGSALLEIEVDFPRLSAWFPGLKQFQLPPLQLTYRGSGEYVRVEGKLRYSQNLPIKLEPWKIPSSLIFEPICSFTAARGVAAVLARFKGASDLKLKQIPNQFCLWGQAGVLAQTQFAVPVADATNTLRELSLTLPRFTDRYLEREAGDFLYVSNRAELLYRTVPYIMPQLRPVRDAGQDYVCGSLFIRSAATNAAPRDLFTQLEKPNLVYYDWEITQERLVHGRQLYGMMDGLNRRRNPSTNAPTQRWIFAAATNLGNSITEISQSGPKELSLVRKSHLGFTGFELATLMRWLDSPGFPLNYEPPPRTAARTNRASNANQKPRGK